MRPRNRKDRAIVIGLRCIQVWPLQKIAVPNISIIKIFKYKYMGKISFFAFLVVFVSVMAGCKNSKTKTAEIRRDGVEDTIVIEDSTIYGKCGENTAMHTLELIDDEGSVHNFMINLDDSLSGVQGGLLNGDRLAVIAQVEYGDTFAVKVINLTTLQGKWASIDRNFEIREGGIVKSNVDAETKPWTNWRIHNGMLVLNKDVFDIIELGADSLYLENEDGIYGFKRLK